MALVLAGFAIVPATAMAGEKYVITAEVWSVYQAYLGKIKNGYLPGAYAITKDGAGAFYVWCEDTRCRAGATYSQDAVNYCEREYDTECVTFAVRDDIRVEYVIVGSTSSNMSAPALSAPPPVTRVVVSAATKSDIDAYLDNAQRAGRAWALAISHDGSKVGTASCQTTGGGGYFGGGGAGCNLVSGGPQEEASREALMRCGGPTKCTLLYEGSQKKARIEIVTPADVQQQSDVPDSAPVVAAVEPVPAPKLALPPPATEIFVSAAVKADIDAYLGNAQRAGRASALAIAQDGAAVAAASCPTSGGWSGGRACDPISGGPQELASREAIMRCGGAAACVLLYEGTEQTGRIKIVTQ